MLKMAKEANITDPRITREIDKRIYETITEEYMEDMEEEEMEHPTLDAVSKGPHIREMIMEGYTDAQILQLHPELTNQDIQNEKQALLQEGE